MLEDAPGDLARSLDPSARRVLEEAARLAGARGQALVEPVHLIAALASSAPGQRLLASAGADPHRVKAQSLRRLDMGRRHREALPTLSPALVELLEAAHRRCAPRLTSVGALLDETLQDGARRAHAVELVPALRRVEATPAQPAPHAPPPRPSREALARYTVDLTARARAGRLDPVIGRDEEIRRLIDILMRRRQNNPLLAGEAGVGKTAVVEGLAARIAAGDVPPALRDVALLALDLGLLEAGTALRGAFEERLKQLIHEVSTSPQPVILFVDEAHTLVGAGGQPGTGDAANLLKPALARGELRLIAATTWAEYKAHIEADPALSRRLQLVRVDEPDPRDAVRMLQGLAPTLERHHGVRIRDEALRDAVTLSHRYLRDRRLPDKAISVLDTACARVAISQTTRPPALEEQARHLERLEARRRSLLREQVLGVASADDLRPLDHALAAARETERDLRLRWAQEQRLTQQLLELEVGLERGQGTLEPLRALRARLATLQGGRPMVFDCVDRQVVARVVAEWSGVPVGRLLRDEVSVLMTLQNRLARRIIGQDHALDLIARRVRTARARLDAPDKPVGAFLLVGPSGTGKTGTALALAEQLCGDQRGLITVNLGEYQQAHSVAGLRGAPPGYVGHGKGGALTEAVRRNPHSVILLDEVEKAHPDVLELFDAVLDQGRMDDAEGTTVDFSNTVILLTSTLGAGLIAEVCARGRPDLAALGEALRGHLSGRLRPGLLARVTLLPYLPLGPDALAQIAAARLQTLARRFEASHGAPLHLDERLAEAIAARCVGAPEGARAIERVLADELLPELSGQILRSLADARAPAAVAVTADARGRLRCREADAPTPRDLENLGYDIPTFAGPASEPGEPPDRMTLTGT
ncbi:MAG: type VI secretion system ATPase TssH [Alphaproteobacteria bacterium]|nr:type VI secretion system ATPase TssH [Alphaproteobacteria bacterium]